MMFMLQDSLEARAHNKVRNILLPIAVGLLAAFLLMLWLSKMADVGLIYSAFCLGSGLLYLAIALSVEVRAGLALAFSITNLFCGLAFNDKPYVLIGWLAFQAAFGLCWLALDFKRRGRVVNSLLVGLNVGAAVAIILSV